MDSPILTSATVAEDGGAVGETAMVEDRAATVHVLRLVLGMWLTTHCPAAKANIAACLLAAPHRGVAAAADSAGGSTSRRAQRCVVVETMAGTVVGRLPCDPAVTTIAEVKELLAAANPAYAACARQRMFLPGSAEVLDVGVTLVACGACQGAAGGAAAGGSDGADAKLVVVLVQAPPRWESGISNEHLIFLNDNKGVKRPGSKSSYPCARTDFLLERPGDTFCVRIHEMEIVANGLTVGVLGAGKPMKNAGSNGVGGFDGSMGFHIVNIRSRFNKGGTAQDLRVNCAAYGPLLEMVKVGDRLRFTLRRASNAAQQLELPASSRRHRERTCLEDSHGRPEPLELEFSINGTVVCPLPMFLPLPLQPLCTLPDDCVLMLEP